MQHKGYDGISAQQIADALEFSKANFFYHVKTKEELLYHIFVDTLQFTIRHLEEVMARQQSASEKLAAVIDLYVQLMTDHAAVMQVWFREKDHLTAKHRAEVERLEGRIKAVLGPFYTNAIGQRGVPGRGSPARRDRDVRHVFRPDTLAGPAEASVDSRADGRPASAGARGAADDEELTTTTEEGVACSQEAGGVSPPAQRQTPTR